MGDIAIGKSSPGAHANVHRESVGSSRVDLQVKVSDNDLRKAGVKFDGFEKVFALLPTRDGKWERVDLKYSGSWSDRGGGGPFDNYTAAVDAWEQDISLKDLRQRGIAFGLEVSEGHGKNSTTVWLQKADDNYKLGGG